MPPEAVVKTQCRMCETTVVRRRPLEALAGPGEFRISDTVWNHVRDKLPYTFEEMEGAGR